MRNIAERDENRVTTLIGVASETIEINGINYIEGITPVTVAVNPITGAIIVEEV